MKKIVTFTLLLCMILTLVACGGAEVTMQEIYDACRTEAMLKNHENVYIRAEMDGEIWRETYLTKDYVYDYIPDDEFPWEQFMTDGVCYHRDAGRVLLYLFITPDGVGDYASERAEAYESFILDEEELDQIIENVSEKDGRITVTSFLSDKNLEAFAEDGMTAGRFEYVLDAKTREIIALTANYTYDDGSTYNGVTSVTYDAEVSETLKEFLGYENQTENLRNVTVVSNPGTDKEEVKSIQAPKGLIIGFKFDEEFDGAVEFYTDADCTEAYDPFADTDSDLTIYVKWAI